MTTALRTEHEIKRFEKWDANGDGVIDRTDYDAEARRIVDAFGETTTSDRGRAVRAALLAMYPRPAEAAGVGPNNAKNQEQYLAANRDLMYDHGDSGFTNQHRPTIAAIADLCDTDRNENV